MNPKPLKVYYCRSCGMRMPQYYRKDEPYRDESWWRCIRCDSTDLLLQVEAWNHQRENAIKPMSTPETLQERMQSAELMEPPAPSAPQRQQGWVQRPPTPPHQHQQQRQAWSQRQGQHQGQRQGQWQGYGQRAPAQPPQRQHPWEQQRAGKGGWQKPSKQAWPTSPQRKPTPPGGQGQSAPQNNTQDDDPFWNS